MTPTTTATARLGSRPHDTTEPDGQAMPADDLHDEPQPSGTTRASPRPATRLATVASDFLVVPHDLGDLSAPDRSVRDSPQSPAVARALVTTLSMLFRSRLSHASVEIWFAASA
jgi:hypothetical protein